ncbi:MAG: hypothetical protein K9M14_02510, partial [Candidatus Omnitrophica bacterium]|nr:hypothetical protein [Candidatus Omnitrophota bacterium]
LLNILAKETGVAASSQQALVFGPHNKEMIVDFAKGQNRKINKIHKAVQFRGAEIVKLFKNKSAVFGPSLACCELVKAIAYNQNRIIPVSVLLKGEYGLKDVCLGTPCVINKAGADRVIEKKINKVQKKKLKEIGFTLRKTLKELT